MNPTTQRRLVKIQKRKKKQRKLEKMNHDKDVQKALEQLYAKTRSQ